MLRKRASRTSFFSSSLSSKRQPTPSPKPGRTLVLSSTSSSLDLSSIAEEGFVFDFEKQKHIDALNSAEPLFLDFYLPSVPIEIHSSPPPLPEEATWATSPSTESSIRWSMDSDINVGSDSDENLDAFESTPPEAGLIARIIKIVYTGKPRMVNLSPERYPFKRPNLEPLQTGSGHTSRTSSVSARDFAMSASSRSSDGESKPSPASSISEYSNLAYETILEEPKFDSTSYKGVNMKPFKRSHHRSRSSLSSNLYLDDMKEARVKVCEI